MCLGDGDVRVYEYILGLFDISYQENHDNLKQRLFCFYTKYTMKILCSIEHYRMCTNVQVR